MTALVPPRSGMLEAQLMPHSAGEKQAPDPTTARRYIRAPQWLLKDGRLYKEPHQPSLASLSGCSQEKNGPHSRPLALRKTHPSPHVLMTPLLGGYTRRNKNEDDVGGEKSGSLVRSVTYFAGCSQ